MQSLLALNRADDAFGLAASAMRDGVNPAVDADSWWERVRTERPDGLDEFGRLRDPERHPEHPRLRIALAKGRLLEPAMARFRAAGAEPAGFLQLVRSGRSAELDRVKAQGLQPLQRLALMLNEVHRGRCTLQQVVRWMCDAPASVWDIIGKGRHTFTAFRTSITATRAPDPPRRVISAQLTFHVHGPVPAAAVERAVALSRNKYCSVWHSLRQDIELTTAFDIVP